MGKPFFGIAPRRVYVSRTVLFAALASTVLLIFTYNSSPSLKSISHFFSPPKEHFESTCTPRAWAAGSWEPKNASSMPPNPPDRMTRMEDALAFMGYETCASSREFFWHLGADNDRIWDRFPGVTSWEWQPGSGCDVRPLDPVALVQDMVQNGGWLLIGDSVTENHFFSLSCLLYPHVVATPNYTENPYYDRAWPQQLFLNRESPLYSRFAKVMPHAFDVDETPLVTFRRVDLLLDKIEMEHLYEEWKRSESAPPEVRESDRELFSEEAFWSLSPDFYVRELFLPSVLTMPETLTPSSDPVHMPSRPRYSTLVVSTGGHWTTTLLPGAALPTEGARWDGIDGVLGFFSFAMERWAAHVQALMDEHNAHREYEARRWGRWGARAQERRKQVMVRAYLPGHEDCHNERAPWRVRKPFVWNWYNWGAIGEFNERFENVLGGEEEGVVEAGVMDVKVGGGARAKEVVLVRERFPDIHFLPIDRPATLRPDAHSASDCLHIMSGAGVLEGWTHYIWHYVSREIPAMISQRTD